MIIGFFLIFNFLSSSLWANTTQPKEFVFCRNQKIIRTIRVDGNSEGCTTTYTKGGIDRIIAEAKYHSSCESILKGVQNNLEKSHWQCRTISKASISGSQSNEGAE